MALDQAGQEPNEELFDFLVNIQGANFNQVNLQKMTPFFKVVKTKEIGNGPYKKCFEILLGKGVDIDMPD
jgi:hypothetical protein